MLSKHKHYAEIEKSSQESREEFVSIANENNKLTEDRDNVIISVLEDGTDDYNSNKSSSTFSLMPSESSKSFSQEKISGYNLSNLALLPGNSRPTPQFAMVAAATACCCYSLCSMSMTFSNKAVLSTFQFKFPLCLLLFQNCFTVLILYLCKYSGLLSFKPMKLQVVQEWIPVNLLFVFMLMSGSYVLKFLSVPMVTIFKNVTTTIVALGDFFLFGQDLSFGIMCSLIMMIGSSVVAGFNDLAFNMIGYIWMMINCIVSAGYVLYMRYAMKRTNLSEWEMVLYNNTLAIPVLLPILVVTGDFSAFFYDLSMFKSTNFDFIWFWTGISGFLLGVSSFWTVKITSPTTYSLVGALNKIPLTILSYFFFAAPMTDLGVASIIIGLFSAALYTVAKQKSSSKKHELLPLTSVKNSNSR